MNARNTEIIRRYMAGETLRSIAAAFGVTRERIRQITVVAGVWRPTDPKQHLPRPTGGPGRPGIRFPEVRQAALEGYGKESASRLGARLGVTKNVIIGHWNRLRKAGAL